MALVHAVAAALRDGLDSRSGPAARAWPRRHCCPAMTRAGGWRPASPRWPVRWRQRAAPTTTWSRQLAEDGDAALLVGAAGAPGRDRRARCLEFLHRRRGDDAGAACRMRPGHRRADPRRRSNRCSDPGPPNGSSTGSMRSTMRAVERCRRWMRLDPHYRLARDALEQRRWLARHSTLGPVTGRVDREGRLTAADPALLRLQEEAGRSSARRWRCRSWPRSPDRR